MRIIAKVAKAEMTILDEQGQPVMQYSVDNSSLDMDLSKFIAGLGKLTRELNQQCDLEKEVHPSYREKFALETIANSIAEAVINDSPASQKRIKRQLVEAENELRTILSRKG